MYNISTEFTSLLCFLFLLFNFRLHNAQCTHRAHIATIDFVTNHMHPKYFSYIKIKASVQLGSNCAPLLWRALGESKEN